MRAEIATKVVRPARPNPTKIKGGSSISSIPETFDVAISFAGTEREYAQKLAEQLRNAGYAVFMMTFIPNNYGERISRYSLTTYFAGELGTV
jgi:hypothetical protein